MHAGKISVNQYLGFTVIKQQSRSAQPRHRYHIARLGNNFCLRPADQTYRGALLP
jgi:hypothetical protein